MKPYSIEIIKRMSVRYYKIKVGEKFYIMDYSNPKDIKNYFSGLFPNVYTKWKIYDYIHHEAYNHSKELKKKNKEWSLILFTLYLVNVMFFPERYNLSDLTYNPRILENWKLVIFLVFFGGLIICIILNIMEYFSAHKFKNDSIKFYWLEKKAVQKKKSRKTIDFGKFTQFKPSKSDRYVFVVKKC